MKTPMSMYKVYTTLIACLLLMGVMNAQEKFANPVSEIIEAEFYGETAPLKSYVEAPNAPNEVVRGLKLGYSPKHDWPLHDAVNPNALPAGPDPAWQKDYTAANSNRAVSFTEDYNGQGFSSVNPPDPVVDVGPNHVIQMINAASGATFQIWDKSGNSLVGPTLMDNFFASAIGGFSVSGRGDPIVLYDQLADRWFMAEFCNSCNDIFILVSTSPDPTSTWYAYRFTAPNFPDYIKFAVWPNTYTMTSNEPGSSPVYALDRLAMLAGNAATMQRFTVPDNPTIGFQAMTPVGVEGPTPPPMGSNAYFMRMTDDAWSASVPADRLEIYDLDVDFATPANSVLSGPTFLTTDPFDTELCGYTSFACMNQPGTGTTLDPLREVLMYKVQYRNFGTHESIVCNHVTDVDNTDRGGIRWYELRRTGGGPWSIYQQGTYSPDADDRWMAAININGDGQIGLLYNRSSSTTFPSIYCTGRNPGDPLGMMTEPETLVEAGTSSNPSNRYGDYSSLSVDPSDEKTFWGTAEYNPSTQWNTRIAAFEFDLPATPCEEVFISEYIEGSGDNKCLEIYNPTDAAIDLSAGNYVIQISFNGGTSTTNIALTGTVASGDVYVVCDNGADAAFLAEADQTPNNSFWNGDDAILLVKNGTVIDYFGSDGEDPGTQWSVNGNMTQNRTLRRNSDVSNGLANNPAVGFPELGTEWTEFPQDNVADLGQHTSDDCAAPPACSITNVMITNGPDCGMPPNQNNSFFDISFTVAGGSGTQYNLLNPANMISYSVIPSATTDGTVTGGGASTPAAAAGSMAQLVVVDANNASCMSTPIMINVPICPPPPMPEAGDIIITEIMKNPNTISDANGEWFEVYNTTDGDIDLMGWEISDDDGESHVIESSVVVSAGGYAALARNGDPGTNGGIVFDYEYGDDITMGNNSDEVILTTPDETEIDRVEYDNGDEFPDPNGESLNLSPEAFDATANDDGFNWCPATSPYAMNNNGTPGAANEMCPCTITDIEMLNISPCNEDDNSFTADVKVSFLRAPMMSKLQLRRDANESVNIGGLDGPTMHTFTSVLFPVADGRDLEIRARFRMDGENLCDLTDDELGPAPQSCLGNDLCEDAVEIGCDETILSTTRGYSNDDNPGGCFTNLSTARGVWFVFTGTGEFIEVTTCGEETDFDTKLGVFEGPCGDLECVAGDDDEDCPFGELTSRVFFQSEVGVDYYIYVTGFGNSRGTFELSVFCIPPPENDDACDATPLTVGVPGVVNNFGATVQDGEPSPGAGTDGTFGSCVSTDGWCEFETEVDNSVWYTIDIAEEGCYEIFTYFRDLQLAVWSVDDCNDFSTFTEVYANDDFGPFGPDGPPFPFPPFPGDGEPGLGGYDIAQRGGDGPGGPGPGPGGSAAPYLNVYLEAGTYYIQVDGFEGEFAFEDVILVQPSEECVLPCEEYNLTLTLTLDAFPQETTWELRDKDGNLYGEGGPYFPFDGPAPGDEGEEPPTFIVIENLCSDEECYDFSIFDSFGDGICCDFGDGGYVFSIDDEIIYEGDGMYGAGETVEICIDPCIIAGYETDDVGSAPTEGEYNCEDDMVVVTTTGQNGFDLGKDNFGYVYQELCGDGEIIAKVESVDNNGWAGIMFRETIDSDAKQAAIYSQLSPITQTQTRYLTGTLKIIQQHFNGPFAMWLKIERQGDWFFSYKSPDGINFSYVHAVNVAMDPCITVGMGAYTSEVGVPVTATFSNIEINGGIVPIATPEADVTFSTQNDGKTKLFPNPANSLVTIDFGATVDRPTTMILRNQLGQVVEQRRLEVPTIRTDWNVSSLVDGLYYIEIRTEGEDAEILRFIKN